MFDRWSTWRIGWACCLAFAPTACLGQIDYDAAPVSYSDSEPTDAIAQLAGAVDDGVVDLQWDEGRGWLPALLDYLSVPAESQTLVFSKTSLQRRHISPSRPRALYFSDDVYIGYIPGAPLIELSAVDPVLGAVFYTVDQNDQERPRLRRDAGHCLGCHANRQTEGVPGYLLRSVFPAEDGEPRLDFGSVATTPASPYKKRYGGWYVTARQDPLLHRGNMVVRGDDLTPLDVGTPELLAGHLNAGRYPAEGSDLAALLVLEHQAQVHNLIARMSHETRQALYYDSALNRSLGRPEAFRSESARRRIASAARRLVDGLLFVGEPPLPGPVHGHSRFAEQFADQGPRDAQGRSLRQLDLTQRLFRFPCSFLIYSDGFDALPGEARAEVGRQLAAALSDSSAEGYQHLSPADRQAIREILIDTKPGLIAERR